jgi:hypothetical protein
MDRKYGYVHWATEYTPFETFLDKLQDCIQWVYDHTVNLYYDNAKQTKKIRIDPWDTWSMDHTLAPIILPMLIQLKENKHGAPYVDPKDVPIELRPKKQTKKQKDMGETDSTHFQRWDYVLDEMIYAFNCKANKDDVWMRFEDRAEVETEQKRISHGFLLFGKYYESLWD